MRFFRTDGGSGGQRCGGQGGGPGCHRRGPEAKREKRAKSACASEATVPGLDVEGVGSEAVGGEKGSWQRRWIYELQADSG